MPFTPIHMGPGIFIKAILQGSFSLMVFGWTQIVMDLQPLLVVLTGEGHLHGFSHTFLGASMLAVISAMSGKYLSEIGLLLLRIESLEGVKIKWWVAFLSAYIGGFSHVLMDGIMHSDVEPFYPLTTHNNFLGLLSIDTLHKLCFYSGLVGTIIYIVIRWWVGIKK